MNKVHNNIKVHNNNKSNNMKVGSNLGHNNNKGNKLSRSLINIFHSNNKANNNNKVKNTCYNSFSNCSDNRSSNFYFNTDRALSLPNVTTNHGNGWRKILHCNIIEDKTIVNTINNSTMLTCSCSSLLQRNVTFSVCKFPREVNMYVITVPPKIWRPKPIDRFIPLPPSPDIDDN